MICEICGIEFFHSKIKKKYCSKKCTEKAYYEKHKLEKKEYYHRYYLMHKGEKEIKKCQEPITNT